MTATDVDVIVFAAVDVVLFAAIVILGIVSWRRRRRG